MPPRPHGRRLEQAQPSAGAAATAPSRIAGSGLGGVWAVSILVSIVSLVISRIRYKIIQNKELQQRLWLSCYPVASAILQTSVRLSSNMVYGFRGLGVSGLWV